LRVLKALHDTSQVKKTIFPKKFHGFFDPFPGAFLQSELQNSSDALLDEQANFSLPSVKEL
jgi:hypothetical protein